MMRRLTFAAIVAVVVGCNSSTARGQDMALSGVLIDGQGWELVAEGLQFSEGPAVDPAGRLYFTDVSANRIYRLDDQGHAEVFAENTSATNGLMFGPDGRLYGCQNGRKRIVAFDSNGADSTIADDVECNDIVVTGKGAVYFTDPGNKRVWYVSPQGEKRIVDEGIETPNGIILWPDQGTLVVADTSGPNLWAFRVEADGGLSFKQPYYTVHVPPGERYSGADGMTVDSAGRLYVATMSGLQMFDPTGRLGGVILQPQKAFLSNAVFAGPDLDTLYVTCTDKVYKRKTNAKGVRY